MVKYFNFALQLYAKLQPLNAANQIGFRGILSKAASEKRYILIYIKY